MRMLLIISEKFIRKFVMDFLNSLAAWLAVEDDKDVEEKILKSCHGCYPNYHYDFESFIGLGGDLKSNIKS